MSIITRTPQSESLLELFESSSDNIIPMYQSQQQQNHSSQHFEVNSLLDSSKPRQVLGESVFNQFVKQQELSNEFPLGLDKLDVPELSPSIGTITPLQLHSSTIESIFDPIDEEVSPMFEEVELDVENWSSLFENDELEVPNPNSSIQFNNEIKQESIKIPSPSPSQSPPPPTKRSSSEASLDLPCSKKSNSSPDVDSLGIIPYNRKQRSQPLSPIIIENSDPISAKRARNTEAARRSRARKMERMNQLEDKVEILVKKNYELEEELERLRGLLKQSGQPF